MTKVADPIAEFRDDHRKVRDGLLDLSEAIQKKQVPQARRILGDLNVMVGPHFRYEEEALYPALKTFLGEYVDQLIKEHDGVIATARTAAQLLGKDSLTDAEAAAATRAARSLLVHVSNCDGLAILTEKFSQNEMDELARKYTAAREAGVALLDWADKIRKN